MKKIFILILLNVMFIFCISIGVNAHSDIVDIDYDQCIPAGDEEGLDEKWYSLFYSNHDYSEIYRHVSEDTVTLKYYVMEQAINDSSYTWNSEVDEILAEEIKDSFVNSMLKWNDVNYYSYDSNFSRTKNKIINIVEGTLTDHDITIYPIQEGSILNGETVNFVAAVGPKMSENYSIITNEENGVYHAHYDKWNIYVNVHQFYFNYDTYYNSVEENKELVGMHEMGHILGLCDIDNCCDYEKGEDIDQYHHEELLMGYSNCLDRITYASYRDIAGVSITRGFHTDSDHIWMKRVNEDYTIDLICALCNGVIYDVELDSDGTYQGKTLNLYKSCKHHNWNNTSSNMILIAEDGERDFFKCLNCRYVEEVDGITDFEMTSSTINISVNDQLDSGESIYYKLSENIGNGYDFSINSTQMLKIELYNDNLNKFYTDSRDITDKNFSMYFDDKIYYIKITNNYEKTVYFTLDILEHSHDFTYMQDNESTTEHIKICENCGYSEHNSHVFDNHYCIYCNEYTASHNYEAPYIWVNIYNHRATCICGETTLQAHAVKSGTTKCLLCGGNAGSGIVQMNINSNGVQYVTINGSFITCEGIIVLVESDIELFLKGELEFYIKNNNLVK